MASGNPLSCRGRVTFPGPREQSRAHSPDSMPTLCPSHLFCRCTQPQQCSLSCCLHSLFLGHNEACEICLSTWPAHSLVKEEDKTGSVHTASSRVQGRGTKSPSAQKVAGPIVGTATAGQAALGIAAVGLRGRLPKSSLDPK